VSTPALVSAFYERIWNCGDLEAVEELLSEDFRFRGSLGSELEGREPFRGYVRAIRGALADYRCDILDCVSENDRAFARMRFSGRHVGTFQGFAPSGKIVSWAGAALFRLKSDVIAELWVVGDLSSLSAMLGANQLV
jgi:steroid delta-isomerase-like uncharacterized protein